MTSPRRVTFSTLIRAEPERVYDAFTTARGLDAWFTTGAVVDRRPGGIIRFHWKDWGPTSYSGENGGAVLEVAPPTRFVFRWLADSGGYETTVETDFVSHPAGTMVTLIEGTYAEDEQGLQDMLNRASGWACVLTLLKFNVEHGVSY